MSTKKVRCKCVRCGKINYLPAAGTDRSEDYLCEPCDDMFVHWFERMVFRCHGVVTFNSLARFLKENPCRTS